MIYFDNAATSFHKPPQVISAVTQALSEYSANPGRSGHDLSVKAAEKVYEARECINDFFYGWGSEYVSFTSNCTEALNIAIKGILRKGDHVVTSCFEHNSVARPLHKLKEQGLIDYSVFNVSYDTKKTIESFRNQFRKNTRLCIVTAVSNVFGNILPLKELARIAHNKGAYFFVDGAQGAGIINLDMQAMGIDCLCIPGHKGLLGPMGTGAILHKNLPFSTLIEGGTGTNSMVLTQPDTYPEKLESGTLNVPGICGLCAGVKYVKDQDVNKIFQKETEIAYDIFEGLKRFENVILYNYEYNPVQQAPVISFNIKNIHSEMVAHYLGSNGVAVRGGYQCSPWTHSFMGTKLTGTVRISPSFLNTEKDIKKLLNLVEKFAI